MRSSQADKEFLHRLFVTYYQDKPEPVQYQACIRCGSRGKLGQRRPYAGLCSECRRGEYSKN